MSGSRPKRAHNPRYAATRAGYAPSLAHRATRSTPRQDTRRVSGDGPEDIAVDMLMAMATTRATPAAQDAEASFCRRLGFSFPGVRKSVDGKAANSSRYESSLSAASSPSFSSAASSAPPHLSGSRARGRTKRRKYSLPDEDAHSAAQVLLEIGSTAVHSAAMALVLMGSGSSSGGGGSGGGSSSGSGSGGGSISGSGSGGGYSCDSEISKEGKRRRSTEDGNSEERYGVESQMKKLKAS